MSEHKFYETTVTIQILSDEPIGFPSLRRLAYLTENLNYGLGTKTFDEKEITNEQMVKLLQAANINPNILHLDENGNKVDIKPLHSHEEPESESELEYSVTATYDPLATTDEDTLIINTDNIDAALQAYDDTNADGYYYEVFFTSKSDPSLNRSKVV